ncbi:MAG: hypothetical protein ACLUGI_10755 [Subdoligranulum sp.]
MELVYVKKGSGIVQVGVNAYPAEQGDIYIFAPRHPPRPAPARPGRDGIRKYHF